jgi:hypothetical protein
MIKVNLGTHPDLIMIDPKWELNGTFDNPKNETFQPSIIWLWHGSRINELLPEQPYVNGTWDDENVNNAIENYIKDNYADKE